MIPFVRSTFLLPTALLLLAACGGSTHSDVKLPVSKAGPDRTASVGEVIEFDGSGSLYAASHHWEFGDDTSSDEAKVEHTYANAGTFVATLTVRNSVGGTDRDTVEITVSDLHAPPTAAIVGPSKGRMGDALTFDGSTSTGASALASYDWAFGDGATASGPSATHFFAANGQYSVQLTVTDTSGLTGSASLTVTIGDDVGNRPPVAVPGHDVTARVGEAVVLDGTASYDLDSGDAVAAYDWDFGDGSAHATADKPTHSWTTAGVYPLKLKVTDTHAATGEASAKATILPPPDYNGRWTLVPNKPSVTCGKASISFPAATLDFTHSGAALTAQDPNLAARKLTGNLTGFHFSTKGVFSAAGTCGTATSTETFSGDFKLSNDQALTGSYAVYHSFSDLSCNCTATFSVTGTRQ
ncbi:MAG: PKD domain-containing protein [Myxococcales bacterium]